MPCYTVKMKSGSAIVCMRTRKKTIPHCTYCSGFGEFLCDHSVGKGKTCDKPVCIDHAQEVGTDRHYCPEHQIQKELF